MATKRRSFASIATDSGPPAPAPTITNRHSRAAGLPIDQVAPNPLNPRTDLGDLTELVESLRANGQLQPCTVVSRSRYLTHYPEHVELIGAAQYVAVTGARRHAAAKLAGLDVLDVIVKDTVASSRESLAAAAIAENIERKDFTVLEEATAVQALVDLTGSGKAAAERLGRTSGWVSQRLALLKLHPDLQAELREGRLPVREARSIATKPPDEQLAEWRALSDPASALPSQESAAANSPSMAARPPRARTDARSSGQMLRFLQKAEPTPDQLAGALRSHFSEAELRQLAALIA